MTDRRAIVGMMAVGAALIACAPASDQTGQPPTGKKEQAASAPVAAGAPPPIMLAPRREPELTLCTDGRSLPPHSSCSPTPPVHVSFEQNSTSWDRAAQGALDRLVDRHRALPGSTLSIDAPSHPSDVRGDGVGHRPLSRALAVQDYLVARGVREEDSPFSAAVRRQSTNSFGPDIPNDRPIVEVHLEHDSYYRD